MPMKLQQLLKVVPDDTITGNNDIIILEMLIAKLPGASIINMIAKGGSKLF
jgi:hypothetical protein